MSHYFIDFKNSKCFFIYHWNLQYQRHLSPPTETTIVNTRSVLSFQNFRDQLIDGSGLPLLTEEHLTSTMNMKLGPALKLRSILAKKLGSCNICLHCTHCHNSTNSPEPGNNTGNASDSGGTTSWMMMMMMQRNDVKVLLFYFWFDWIMWCNTAQWILFKCLC